MLSLLTLLAIAGTASAPVPADETKTLRQVAKRGVDVGTAAASWFFNEPEYLAILGSEFSVLEAENEMKWSFIHPRPDTDAKPYDFTGADKLVDFARQHRMKVRGHTLVWHNQNAPWVTRSNFTPEQLSAALKGHIETVVSHYRGKVYAWDVVNEAFVDDGSLRHSVWYDRPGVGLADGGTKYIEQAFRWARAVDRRAKLFYNDYSAETMNKKSDAIYAMVKDFKSRRVPIDGIGFQMHLDLSFAKPEALNSLRQNLARFAALGVDIHVTELDIRLKDNTPESLQAQAKLYEDLLKVCLEQPRCKLIQIWAFTDKHSWIPQIFRNTGWALPWDDNYRKKPAYEGIAKGLKG